MQDLHFFQRAPHVSCSADPTGLFPVQASSSLQVKLLPQVWEQGLTFPSPLGWTPDLHNHGPASVQSGSSSHVGSASSLKCLAEHLAVVYSIFMLLYYSRTHVGVSCLLLSNETSSSVSGDAAASVFHLLTWLPQNFFPVRVMEQISQRSRGCPIPGSVHATLDKAWSNPV